MSTRAFPALGFDPAPGNLTDAEHLARMVRDASAALSEVNSVVSAGTDETWRGQAATAFRDLVGDDLAPAVRDAYQSFDEAARALTGWTTTLSAQQRRADAIERRRFNDAKGVADGIPALVQPATNLGERLRNTFSGDRPFTHDELRERRRQAS